MIKACLKAESVALVLRAEGLVDAGQRKGALAELRGGCKGWEGMAGYCEW